MLTLKQNVIFNWTYVTESEEIIYSDFLYSSVKHQSPLFPVIADIHNNTNNPWSLMNKHICSLLIKNYPRTGHTVDSS